MKSRQAVQQAAGNKDADFHKLDEVKTICRGINQEAIDQALKNANTRALDRYQRLGKKLVVGNDTGPYNAGPLWIWNYMTYTDNSDKTETTINSPMMQTPTDYPIKVASGFHQCKLLSPFRAMEWI